MGTSWTSPVESHSRYAKAGDMVAGAFLALLFAAFVFYMLWFSSQADKALFECQENMTSNDNSAMVDKLCGSTDQ